MRIYPEQIIHLGDSRYRVKIVTTSPSGTHEFEFAVTGAGIRIVESPAEFDRFLDHSLGDARYLLEAILALDKVQGTDITRVAHEDDSAVQPTPNDR
jgi:hypothetical protein